VIFPPLTDAIMPSACSTKPWGRVAITLVWVMLSVLLSSPFGISHAQQRSNLSTVRGKVQRQQASRSYPATNVRVTLTAQTRGARSLIGYTGNDGMFYFRNVPAGVYRLEVWSSRPTPVVARDVTVRGGEPYVDVAPITI
jgi:carboxypeptidase family protein